MRRTSFSSNLVNSSDVMILLVILCTLAQTFAVMYELEIEPDYSIKGLVVETAQGRVIGSSSPNGDYYNFFGIHYGGDTGGENRFKAPTPAPNYIEPFNAQDSSILCAQPSPEGLIGTEDCLTVNIFTNGTNPTKPVLVWLTGEDYKNNDPNVKSFNTLVLEGVVVVQMNHRLSVFGFLCLGIPEAPGNAGLKDVVQGLKWIQQNIASFGGNPKNVILFGHGSGAAMVDLITLSPLAKGLFHKAIAQSGSALAPWAVALEPLKYANAFGAQLGYTNKSDAELAKLLANTDVNLLINAVNKFEFYNETVLFAPCVENYSLNDTFLYDDPMNILKSGHYNHVPYITGYTSKEGTIRAKEAVLGQWLNKMQDNFSSFLPANLHFCSNSTEVERSIRQFYFADRNIDMEAVDSFLDYQGDTMILVPVITSAMERAVTSFAPVRLYEFAFRGTQNSDWAFSDDVPLFGARHGDVLKYLLDIDLRPTLDQSVRDSLMRRYITFFNTGSQEMKNDTEMWLPYKEYSPLYFEYSGGETFGPVFVTKKETIKENPHPLKMNFWNEIYNTRRVTIDPVNLPYQGKRPCYKMASESDEYIEFVSDSLVNNDTLHPE